MSLDHKSYKRMSEKFSNFSKDYNLSKLARMSFSGKKMRFDRSGNLHIVDEDNYETEMY